MTTELELAQMLDKFVDDLNEGVTPRIYELMASGSDAADDLIPLLDLVAQFKASTTENEEGSQLLQAFLDRVRQQIESQPASGPQEPHYYDDEYEIEF